MYTIEELLADTLLGLKPSPEILPRDEEQYTYIRNNNDEVLLHGEYVPRVFEEYFGIVKISGNKYTIIQEKEGIYSSRLLLDIEDLKNIHYVITKATKHITFKGYAVHKKKHCLDCYTSKKNTRNESISLRLGKTYNSKKPQFSCKFYKEDVCIFWVEGCLLHELKNILEYVVK